VGNSASWVLERLESLSREQLIQIILDQHRMIEELRAEIEQLKRRGGAAPFSRGTRKTDSKAPGRKPGQGFFRFRGSPELTAETETTRVPVAAPCCPDCGGALGCATEEIVSITDVPAQPQPEVRRYAVEIRHCHNCRRTLRGSHPDIVAGQQGATAHRLGPRVKALAHLLHYAHGVPVRKTPAIVREMTGVRLSQAGLTQDAMKQAEGNVGARYRRLRESVAQQRVMHTDDTGWRVAGRTAFLMAFVNPTLSVYQIRSRHRNEEVRELVPADFTGTLICDRGKSYDADELSDVAQQKCLSHLLRNASDVAKTKKGPAKRFSLELKDLLREALKLRAARPAMEHAQYWQQVEEVKASLTHHLRNRILRDDDNQRLLNGVGTRQDRGNLLRFLDSDAIEPTNNRAERALRPAVIARKVSHCSRNQRGARAFEAFTSVIQTLLKTAKSDIGTAFAELLAPAATLSS
jgi:transposase